MHILTVETSCDETAVAIGQIVANRVKILSHAVASQMKLHSAWGGVVPDLAAREHLKNLVPTLEEAFRKAGFKSAKGGFGKIKLIGVTNGPGLAPALITGLNFAKTLSFFWGKPLMPINHLEGHLYAPWINRDLELGLRDRIFPALGLLVSGGHTLLIEMRDHLEYEILGGTLDDAVGEAFDKVARIVGLGYPGGPLISKLALEGDPDYSFSVPLKNSGDLNFSFSGLKTAVLYKALTLSKNKSLKEVLGRAPKPDLGIKLTKKQKADLARAFESTAIEALKLKTLKALKRGGYRSFILGGGVAANSLLRERLELSINEFDSSINIYFPKTEHTGDNAAMLVPPAYLRFCRDKKISSGKKYFDNWKKIEIDPNLKLH